jgi:hypothetical protein
MNGEMVNPLEQILLVRVNIIDQSKCQSKCHTQKAAQPFNNGFFKELLLIV